MLRRRPILLLALFALLAAACGAAARGPSLAMSYDPAQVRIVDDGASVRLAIDGTRTLKIPGAPALPVEYFQFVIPADATVDEVILTALTEETLPGSYRVAPAQPETRPGGIPMRAAPDPEIYESDAEYPASRVHLLEEGHLGGYRIASVAVYPLTYAPATGRLTLAENIEFELVLVASIDESRPRHRMSADSDRLYRRLVEGMVANPAAVAGERRSVEIVDGTDPDGFDPRYTPSLEGSAVEYVIVTSDELVAQFQVLADWKTKKGVPTVIKTVSWIETTYAGGCDTAERIRHFIEDAYTSWGTTYVLLGGDTDVIPVRTATSTYDGGWGIPTDLYYSDLDGNWNADGDSDFGEGYDGILDPGDAVDLYPDVFVGRAPVSTTVEAQTFVDKVLAYEGAPDTVFSGRILFMAEVLFPYNWSPGELADMDGAEHVVERVLPLIPPEMHYTRLYENYEEYPGSYPLSRQAAIDSLNAGYNISVHVGHGNKDAIGCGGSEFLSSWDVDALENGQDESGFVWMLNCSTAPVELESISEHFLMNPNGGSSSLFGATRWSFPQTVKDYFYEWFDDHYVEDVRRQGVACATCKLPFIPMSGYDNTDRWTQFSYLFLGDPETALWVGQPTALSVIHPTSLGLGPSNVTVSVWDLAAVGDALVCLAKDGEVYATGRTSGFGQVTLPIAPKTAGVLTVTVTSEDHLPYEGTIEVTASAGPHLSLRSAVVDDDEAGFSDGNGNGQAEAGEALELDVTIENAGLSFATDLTATLGSGDPYISLIDGTHFLGDIDSMQQIEYQDAFLVIVADSCPNEHEVSLELSISDEARTVWTDDLVFRVYRPDLIQALNAVDDGAGGDGTPDVGDTVALTVDLLNDGNGLADLVTGVLRYPGVEVAITDSTDTWGSVGPGETATGEGGFTFEVLTDPAVNFSLILTDEDGKVWSHSFDLARPAPPVGLAGTVNATTVVLRWDQAE